MSSYKSSAELKALAKEHMFGHYGAAIGAHLFVILATDFFALMAPGLFGNLNTFAGTCIYYIVSFLVSVFTGLFTSGLACFYLKITCGQHVTVYDVFQGFRSSPEKALTIQAWISVFAYTVNLPGFLIVSRSASSDTGAYIAFALSMAVSAVVTLALNLLYGQAFFLLHDFPQYSTRQLLAGSRKLMSGHKAKLFYIYISFLPLLFLALPSCGIVMLWLMPYMDATLAEFYLDIVKGAKK